MSEPRPSVVILAGPNGAGKSTAAPELLQGELAVNEFVNADVIARGLSAFDPDRAAIAAGRVPIVSSWAVYNCSGPRSQLVAEGLESAPVKVYDREVWAAVQRQGTE
jgi:predicted ABC-type ATPase